MKLIVRVFLLITLGYAVFSWYRIVTTTAPDFSVYYGAAKLLIEGKSLSGDTGLYTGFGYPPTTLLLFFPFLLFPYQIAQGIWISLSFLLVPVCVFLSLKIIGVLAGKERREVLEKIAVWSSIFFWSFPTRWTLGMGQINLLSLFFFLSFVMSQKTDSSKFSRHDILKRILFLTLLIVSKPQMGLIFFFLLFFKSQWKVVLFSIIFGLILSGCVGTFFGWSYFTNYFTKEVPQLTAFVGREIYFNQSLGGFFSRIAFVGIAKMLTEISSVFLLGVIGVIGGVGGIEGRKKIPCISMMFLFLPVYLLVEPLGWQHHLVFLMPVYIWMVETLKKDKREKKWKMGIWMGLVVLSFFLISFNIKDPSVFYATSLLRGTILSHGFWGTFLLLWLLIKKTIRTRNNTSN